MAKKKIEFLTDCPPGWIEGYITPVEMETETDYYFNDEWDRWSLIPKSKENVDYKIIQPRKRKPKEEPPFQCGGKDVTFKRLTERVQELHHK